MESEIAYPLRSIDTDPYWEGCRQSELRYKTCDECSESVFYPRAICPYCMSDKLTWRRSSGRGKIYSFAIQHHHLVGRRIGEGPIALGIIEMQEGYHMFSEIVCEDLASLSVGTPVECFFVDVAKDLTLPKFRPTEGARS